MRNLTSFVCTLSLAIGPMLFSQGCRHDDGSSSSETTPGPAEKAGQKVDEAAHDTKEGAKDAAQATKEGAKEAAHETGEAARGAASAVGSATERAGQKMQGK
ncbi:MAG: hypothetical protein MUF34_34095 [Polyangiaceae bacterium]|jgi:hypothetical protein|nr:hypothetical protein [Polyangiaceae bacterium]